MEEVKKHPKYLPSYRMTGKCKCCEAEFNHQYYTHRFETQNNLERCRYLSKIINHYKEYHQKCVPPRLSVIGECIRLILKGILIDLFMIIVYPIRLSVSGLFKALEWLNDRIGLFD